MTALLFKLAFAGIRSRLLASALTIAARGRRGGDDRARARGGRERRAIPGSGRSTPPTARTCSRPCPRRPTRARSRRSPASPSAATPVPRATRPWRPRGRTELQLAGLRAPHARQHARADRAARTLREGGIVLERSFADALGIEVGDDAPAGGRGAARSSSRCSGRRSCPASRATRAATRAWPGSRAPRSSASSPTAVAGAGRRRSGWRIRPPRRGVRRARGGIPARPARRVARDLAGPARRRAGRCPAARGDPDDVHDRAARRRLRRRRRSSSAPAPAQQHREIGLLKAVGLTPRQVGAVFALESAALGLVAVGVGFALGALLAPRLAAPSAETLLGSPTIAANPWHLLVASCVVLPVLVASVRCVDPAQHPLQRPRRRSAPAPRRPPPRSRLARAVARSRRCRCRSRSGSRTSSPRRQRALLLAAAIALTGAAMVFALSMQATLDAQTRRRSQRRPGRAAGARLHARRRAAGDHRHDARRGRAAVGARAHPRLRRAQGDRAHAPADRLEPRQRPRRPGAGRGARCRSRSASRSTSPSTAIAGGSDRGPPCSPRGGGSPSSRSATVLVVVAATSLPARLATRIRTADALRYE